MAAELCPSAPGLAVAVLTGRFGSRSGLPASAAPGRSAPVAVDAPPAPRTEANMVAQAKLVSRLGVGTGGTP